MLYAIISKNPIVYIYQDNEEILKSDYEFIIENPKECGMPEGFTVVDYKALAPSEFSKFLDEEVNDEDIYTFKDGCLNRRKYRRAPYFYVEPAFGLEYQTYCPNPNTIKAGLLNNEKLTSIISTLVADYCPYGYPKVSIDIPLTVDEDYDDANEVLAYVCLPLLMRKIPIGNETAEEHQELLEDSDEI